LLSSPTVSQGYGNCTFCSVLADDKAVQFRHDFAGGKISHGVTNSGIA
jgi:hypothetical protein